LLLKRYRSNSGRLAKCTFTFLWTSLASCGRVLPDVRGAPPPSPPPHICPRIFLRLQCKAVEGRATAGYKTAAAVTCNTPVSLNAAFTHSVQVSSSVFWRLVSRNGDKGSSLLKAYHKCKPGVHTAVESCWYTESARGCVPL
jgi:hypothetical protein